MKRASAPRRKENPVEPVAGGTGAPQAVVHEAIDRFVQLLARMGTPSRELKDAVTKACARHARAFEGRTARYLLESQAAHILTVWYSEPMYVDRDGAPIALPARGVGPSIEALTASLGEAAPTAEVIRYLVKAKALKRRGSKYVPQKRDALFQGPDVTGRYRNLLPLLGMLSTLLHNASPHEDARNWFEVRAYNPRFPRRARGQFASKASRLALEFLKVCDEDLHRFERTVKPGEPTVHTGIGVYQYEEPVPSGKERRGASARKPRSRKHK